mmetsp:Transcript_48226/g.159810  ORF Transcript_48226/g.159810 Transcript_48226/m.159810 type:complete len:204 (-) Transcript_48226:1693-2304(-)
MIPIEVISPAWVWLSFQATLVDGGVRSRYVHRRSALLRCWLGSFCLSRGSLRCRGRGRCLHVGGLHFTDDRHGEALRLRPLRVGGDARGGAGGDRLHDEEVEGHGECREGDEVGAEGLGRAQRAHPGPVGDGDGALEGVKLEAVGAERRGEGAREQSEKRGRGGEGRGKEHAGDERQGAEVREGVGVVRAAGQERCQQEDGDR